MNDHFLSQVARKGSHQGEGGDLHQHQCSKQIWGRVGDDRYLGSVSNFKNHVANLTTGLPGLFQCFSKLLWGDWNPEKCRDQVPQSSITPGIPSIGRK